MVNFKENMGRRKSEKVRPTSGLSADKGRVVMVALFNPPGKTWG